MRKNWMLSAGLMMTLTACDGGSGELINDFGHAANQDFIPGISVAAGNLEEGVIWARGYGYADIENGVPMKEDTKLRIASISKVFATAGLARLMDEGKIDLDAPIQTYAPSFPDKGAPVTLRTLTGHQSGARGYKAGEFLLNTRFNSVEQGLALWKDDPLAYEPRTEVKYSTHAWTLISAAMEGASGEDFLPFMQAQVFDPLNMTSTVPDYKKPLIENRARAYVHDDALNLINAPQVDLSYKWAGGGFLSTTSDVVTFALAHLGDDYLTDATRNELFTTQNLADGEETGFGIGWMVGWNNQLNNIEDRVPEGKDDAAIDIMGRHMDVVMHSGGAVGGNSMMILCKTHKHAAAVSINVSDAQGYALWLALRTLDTY